MNYRFACPCYRFQNFRMTVADRGAHLAGGEIQDCAAILGVQIRTFCANNQLTQEITPVVKKVLVIGLRYFNIVDCRNFGVLPG